jgi:hypothetical protein
VQRPAHRPQETQSTRSAWRSRVLYCRDMDVQQKIIDHDDSTAWFRTLDKARSTFWTPLTMRVLVQAWYSALFVLCIVGIWYIYFTLKGSFIEFMQSTLFSKIGSMR